MHKHNEAFDLFIIGGGINGAGIARDAAGRGLKVGLCEQDDLGGATSWTSSKLIHGGLRYLEHYEFRLVRESLAEREVLLRVAPHLVHPLRFVMPHVPALRPTWMIRAGLLLYDHLSPRVSLAGSRGVKLQQSPLGVGLKPDFRRGFAYSDCQVDDARLVIANVRAAASLGTRIMVRTACTGAENRDGVWQLTLENRQSGARGTVAARALVNAAGPWVAQVRNSIARVGGGRHIRLIKGSHIVVPRVHAGAHAFILQNDDGRVVFVIPFEERYSLIGTTEVEVDDLPAQPAISDEEVQYLCRAVGRYLAQPPRPEDVCWSFSGLRPLFGENTTDPSSITRGYELDLNLGEGAPVLTVYGGKITTYRRLAEQALARLKPHLRYMNAPWTQSAALPGGEIADFEGYARDLMQTYPALPPGLLTALARRHGSLCRQLLADARDVDALGEHFGAGLYAREIDYLIEYEWAHTAEDVLWRRTKVGLHMTTAERARVEEYLARRSQPAHAKIL